MSKSVKSEAEHISVLKYALMDAQNKLDRATMEIACLDSQISYLRKLFRRAEKNNGYAVRYNLRMQLSIISGVKVMYHHYAAMKEEKISHLRALIGTPDSPPPEDEMEDRNEV